MPNGMKIERRKIRGIVSNGMLCSARELGLGEDHQGILQLDVDVAPGTPFLSVMPTGDTRLVIDVGANRPDLLSHLGIARELTAITGQDWQFPRIPDLAPASIRLTRVEQEGETAGIRVRVDRASKTRRYMGAVIRDVKIAPTPDWLVQRLAAVGVRSINNVVDATNYVLHEIGQPIHAFDLAKLDREVIVRLAKPGETIVTLDGSSRALPAGAVVIADAARAHAVAGVMGGRDSEVTESTTSLFVEVASFEPKLTRAARRAIGLSTDASYRFERGVDPELAPVALERVVRLILTVAGGSLDGAPVDVVAEVPPRIDVTVRMARVAQVLGEGVPVEKARKYLERAGFTIVSATDRELATRVPSWRTDVTTEVDLVEEIARFHGYDVFPTEIRPFRPTSTHDDALWTVADELREAMVGLGLLEIRPMPFVAGDDATHLRVDNPLAENEAHLRNSLLETLARRAEYNLSHRSGDVRLFEIGSAFSPSAGGKMPREQLRLGVVIMGRRRPPHFTEAQPPMFDEWDAKGIAEIAASRARRGGQVAMTAGSGATLWEIHADGRVIGKVVKLALDAPVWAAPAFAIELVLGEMETEPAAPRGEHSYKEGTSAAAPTVRKYQSLPSTPPAEFDLALLVPHSTTVAEVESVIRSAAGDLLERLNLFDEYRGAEIGAATRSLAWRLTLRHPERTLRDKEIEGRRSRILAALEQELHVRQRTT